MPDKAKIHIKRAASQRGSLCGRFPIETFRLISDLPKLSEEQRESICKTCLEAAERDFPGSKES